MIRGSARSSMMANVTDFRRSEIWTFKSTRPDIRTDVPVAPVYLVEGVDARAWATPDVRYYGV